MKITVDGQGIRFGNAWVSHEQIAGDGAGIVQTQYGQWFESLKIPKGGRVELTVSANKFASPPGVSSQAVHQRADLELAREFADQHETFDDTFITSLEADFDRRGWLTDPQYTALTNIIEKWRIHEWEEKR